MILLDYSQTVIGSFMAMGRGKPVVEEDLLRHTILNSIRMFRNQFAKDYGEMVICCDGLFRSLFYFAIRDRSIYQNHFRLFYFYRSYLGRKNKPTTVD